MSKDTVMKQFKVVSSKVKTVANFWDYQMDVTPEIYYLLNQYIKAQKKEKEKLILKVCAQDS